LNLQGKNNISPQTGKNIIRRRRIIQKNKSQAFKHIKNIARESFFLCRQSASGEPDGPHQARRHGMLRRFGIACEADTSVIFAIVNEAPLTSLHVIDKIQY
jgi:hypothetical protein